jgi:ubiquitin-conjugating enzyme E2 M
MLASNIVSMSIQVHLGEKNHFITYLLIMFRPGQGRFKHEGKKTAVAAPNDNLIAGTGVSPWCARLHKDLSDLNCPENAQYMENKDLKSSFSIIIKPREGYWKGGIFEFKFNIPTRFPFEEGPKVTCLDKIWHPNIDLNGGVCVNVLRPWKATHTIETVMYGLLHLFSDPNPNDPLNEDAARQMRDDPSTFQKQVFQSLNGDFTVKDNESKTIYFSKNRGFK